MADLDEILKDDATETTADKAAPEQAEKAAPEPKADAQSDGQPRGADGKFAAKEPKPETPPQADAKPTGETTAAPPAAKETQSQIPIAAILDEREKRQRAEQRAALLERQLQEHMSRANQQPRPDPDLDPDGARAYDERRYQNDLIDNKVNVSFELMAAVTADFNEVFNDPETGWAALRSTNPGEWQRLYNAAIQQNNPAKYVYEHLKNQRVLRTIGDPVSYRQKLEQELRAQIEAELAAKYQGAPTAAAGPAPRIPASMADAPASNGRANASRWAGPTPLDSLLS